jgi:putative modified peptide
MSPSSTRAFAERLAEDDAFRARVAEDPRTALAEYGLPDQPGLIPDVVELPSKSELAMLAKKPKPEPPPPPPPEPDRPFPITAQLFDPA